MNRGRPSAIHELLRLGVETLQHGSAESPVNVGLISGGLSINAIAPTAQLTVEKRSIEPAELARFQAVLEGLTSEPPLELDLEILGERPAGRMPRDHPLLTTTLAARASLGLDGALESGSTDANAAMGLGIPAISLGVSRGRDMHTTYESIQISSLELGARQLELILEAMLGAPGRPPTAARPRRGVARLADVAERAGVGSSIASRVLNDDPTVGVRPETRERILEAAKALNYRPNAAARGLKSQRTTTIGLVIPNLAYPVNSEIINGAQTAASEAGYVLLIADAEEFMQAGQAYHRLLLEGRVDGLLLASASTAEPLLRDIINTDLPLILVNRRAGSLAPSVTVDDALGMRLGVEHLIGLGHAQIGYVSGRATPTPPSAGSRGSGARCATPGSTSGPTGWWSRRSTRPADMRRARSCCSDGPSAPTALTVWSVGAAIGVLAGLASRASVFPKTCR